MTAIKVIGEQETSSCYHFGMFPVNIQRKVETKAKTAPKNWLTSRQSTTEHVARAALPVVKKRLLNISSESLCGKNLASTRKRFLSSLGQGVGSTQDINHICLSDNLTRELMAVQTPITLGDTHREIVIASAGD